MKHFCCILFIALMIGEIFSAPQDGTNHLEVFNKFKDLMQDVQPILKAVIRDIPATENYKKYRLEQENILKKISEKSDKTCFEKHFDDLKLLLNAIKRYKKIKAQAEAKKVLELILKHGHETYMKKQWFLLSKDDLIELKQNIGKLDKTDPRFKIFTEVC